MVKLKWEGFGFLIQEVSNYVCFSCFAYIKLRKSYHCYFHDFFFVSTREWMEIVKTILVI